ncbi:MAG: hypothetical protein ACRYGK_05115 [Janthinobacterium lividum]
MQIPSQRPPSPSASAAPNGGDATARAATSQDAASRPAAALTGAAKADASAAPPAARPTLPLYASGSNTSQALLRSRLASNGLAAATAGASAIEAGRMAAAGHPALHGDLHVSVAADSGVRLRSILQTLAPERVHQIRLTGADFTAADIALLASLPQLQAIKVICGVALPTASLMAIGSLKQLTELDLSTYRALKPGDLALVERLPHLRKLNLENRSVVDDAAIAFLTNAGALEELNLGSCAIGDLSADVISGLHKLTHLILDGTAVSDRMLQRLPALASLQVLGMARCQGFSSAALANLLPALPALEVLHLTMCHQLSNAVFDTVAAWPPLRQLFAARVAWDDDALQAMANLQTLEKIVLKLNPLISHRGIGALGALPRLTYLDLHGCAGANAAAIGKLVERGNSPLQTLYLENCKAIDDAALLAIGQGAPGLRRLVLDGCSRISATGVAALLPAQQLDDFSVAYCEGIGNEAMRHIGGFTHLTKLNIANCTAVDKEGLEFLLPLQLLTDFTISGCPFTDDSMAVLGGLVNLERLTAEYCMRSKHYPQTDKTLAVLSQLTSLRQLKLSGNPNMTRAGILQLCSLPHLAKLYFYPSAVPLEQIKDAFPRASLLHSGPLNLDRGPGNRHFFERPEEISPFPLQA